MRLYDTDHGPAREDEPGFSPSSIFPISVMWFATAASTVLSRHPAWIRCRLPTRDCLHPCAGRERSSSSA